MELTAILLRYWANRDANFPRIIDDLRNGTRAPDEIIVVDQGPGPCPDLGVPVIRMPRNYRTRARYAVALLHPTPYHLFVDDDLTVERETVEIMMAAARPGRVVSARGVAGDVHTGTALPEGLPDGLPDWMASRPCDWLIGRLHLTHWRALVRYFEAEERYRLGLDHTLDCADMLLGRVNDCVVVPAPYQELSTFGVGLEHQAGYETERQRAVDRFAEVGL